MRPLRVSLIFFIVSSAFAQAEEVRLATTPALSPDGQTLAFAWAGDLWTVPTAGGVAAPPGRLRPQVVC